MYQKIAVVMASLLLVLGVAVPGQAWFWGKGHLKGTVTDARNSKPLEGVQVFQEEAGISTVTDAWGGFFLRDLPAGNHLITVRKPAYNGVTLEETIQRNKTGVIQVSLRPTVNIYDLPTWMRKASQRFAEIMTEQEYKNLRIGIAFYRQTGAEQCGLPDLVLRFATQFNQIGQDGNLIVISDMKQASLITNELRQQNQFRADFDPATVAAIGKKVGANVMIIGALIESRDYIEPLVNGVWVEQATYMPGLSINEILLKRGELRCE